jgi:hypothetical protein
MTETYYYNSKNIVDVGLLNTTSFVTCNLTIPGVLIAQSSLSNQDSGIIFVHDEISIGRVNITDAIVSSTITSYTGNRIIDTYGNITTNSITTQNGLLVLDSNDNINANNLNISTITSKDGQLFLNEQGDIYIKSIKSIDNKNISFVDFDLNIIIKQIYYKNNKAIITDNANLINLFIDSITLGVNNGLNQIQILDEYGNMNVPNITTNSINTATISTSDALITASS